MLVTRGPYQEVPFLLMSALITLGSEIVKFEVLWEICGFYSSWILWKIVVVCGNKQIFICFM